VEWLVLGQYAKAILVGFVVFILEWHPELSQGCTPQPDRQAKEEMIRSFVEV
jgi:hypothetical protein